MKASGFIIGGEMNSIQKKYYRVYDSYRPAEDSWLYFTNWVEAAGKPELGNWYSEYQIKKLCDLPSLSETTKRRIWRLREGTSLKLCRLHSCGDLMIQRVSSEKVSIQEKITNLVNQKNNLQATIKIKCSEEMTKIYEIEKEIRKLEKQK